MLDGVLHILHGGCHDHLARHVDRPIEVLGGALDAKFPQAQVSLKAKLRCSALHTDRALQGPSELRQPLVQTCEGSQIRLPQVHVQRDRPLHQALLGCHSGQGHIDRET